MAHLVLEFVISDETAEKATMIKKIREQDFAVRLWTENRKRTAKIMCRKLYKDDDNNRRRGTGGGL